MERRQLTAYRATLSLAAVLAAGSTALAASSLSNSLKGFTGDSTQVATQTAVTAAGLEFFSIEGASDDLTRNPTVTFDDGGAHFGLQFALDGLGGDGGRNYMRTIDSDYATTSFVAEITFDATFAPELTVTQVFIGMGSGDTALYGVPDWGTQFSSTFVTPEAGFLKSWSSANDVNWWNDNDPVPAISGIGTHRIQMSYNATTHAIVYAIDVNYAGGAFAADYTAPSLDLNAVNCPENCGGGTDANLYDPADGWPVEASRLYFGGDDQVVFKDFSVVVSTPANANFNGDANIDGADFLIWQKGLGIGTGATLAQGDADGNGAVNEADLAIWKSQFGTPPAGGGAAPAPEPGAAILAGLALAGMAIRRPGIRKRP
jgi:hypothetical protein